MADKLVRTHEDEGVIERYIDTSDGNFARRLTTDTTGGVMDIRVRHENDLGVIRRFRDMGDGTWAEVVVVDITFLAAPPASASPGITGQLAKDNDYIYLCVAPNEWRRAVMEIF